MRLDLHCHTKEGSLDGVASVESYVKKLIELGYDGMLITDHNSYKGYDHWLQIKNSIYSECPKSKDFVVLRGIEYDTLNAGHMIIVLPEGVSMSMFEARGLSAQRLTELVHELGGIIGPAHPYGTGFFAIMNTRFGKNHPEYLKEFDFVETFNGKTSKIGNEMAYLLAKKYKKPQWAGSDSHKIVDVGKAFAIFQENISNNNDLIAYVKSNKRIIVGGEHYAKLHRFYSKFVEECGIIGYWIYNKLGAIYKLPARRIARRQYLHQRR